MRRLVGRMLLAVVVGVGSVQSPAAAQPLPPVPSPTPVVDPRAGLAPLVPPPPVAAQTPPPVPIRDAVPSFVDPQLPSLSLRVEGDSANLLPGDTTLVTVTVRNGAAWEARNLTISLPIPDGARLVKAENLQPVATTQAGTSTDGIAVVTQAPDSASIMAPLPTTSGLPLGQQPVAFAAANPKIKADTWQWPVGTLAGQSEMQHVLTLRLDKKQPTGAVLLTAEAIADGLPLPVRATGGLLVDDPDAQGASETKAKRKQKAGLKSKDGRLTVTIPDAALPRDVTVRYRPIKTAKDDLKGKKIPLAPALVSSTPGLGAFVLDATDDQGNAVRKFDAPLEIALTYTPEQLLARGLSEADVTLFWFDEAALTWQPLPTQVDTATRTVRGTVDHFTQFAFGDGSSPSRAYMPNIQDWQVSQFTGTATASYPIEVPVGPAGLKPQLTLSYNSGATDGYAGMRHPSQAGWVGKGWSLDTGEIALNKLTINPGTGYQVRYYSLAFNGQSHQFVRGVARVGNPSENNPADWTWHSTDESFIRVEAVVSGMTSQAGPGMTDRNNNGQPRHVWIVYTKDGTRYEFDTDTWWGFCADANSHSEAYRWLLSRVIDVHGNQIRYEYLRDQPNFPNAAPNCGQMRGTSTREIWPTNIYYGANPTQGLADRHRIAFNSAVRANDLTSGAISNQYGGAAAQLQQTRQLNAIEISSLTPTNGWQLVRQYRFGYNYSLVTDRAVCWANCTTASATYDPATFSPKLTLEAFRVVGNNGTDALPQTIFTYGLVPNPDSNGLKQGGWNRLTRIANAYGGSIEFSYENIERVLGNRTGAGDFGNHHRVVSRTLDDNRGNRYTWTYGYGQAAYNTLGQGASGDGGVTAYPNSAVLYYNRWIDNLGIDANKSWLAVGTRREFRGHEWVDEVAPGGATTRTTFYQGQGIARAYCNPTTTGSSLIGDTCFQELQQNEMLKGRPRLIELRDSRGRLALTEHRYTVEAIELGREPKSGLWRSFRFTNETTETTFNHSQNIIGGELPLRKTTRYRYDPAFQGNRQYGNLTHIELLDTNNQRLRETRMRYAIRDAADGYLANRVFEEEVVDTTNTLRSRTYTLYGNASQPGTLPDRRGLVTRVSRFLNSPVGLQNTTYTYDAFGNRTGETTYDTPGTINGSVLGPLAGIARTTTTEYDSHFRSYPTKVINPLGHSQLAEYDYRMGTLTRIVDANNVPTSAAYDIYGRLTRIDEQESAGMAQTKGFVYYDYERPTYHMALIYGTVATDAQQELITYYDGLGRSIQTRQESAPNGSEWIVTDTRYNERGAPIAVSQPRYVAANGGNWWAYVTPGANLHRATNTSYDTLGRVTQVQQPDGAQAFTFYGSVDAAQGRRTWVDTIDTNRHRTQQRFDEFGRLREVSEVRGNCGLWQFTCAAPFSTSWAEDGLTRYEYDPLDRVTTTTDALSNQTSVVYDSLGRKTQQREPNTGTWNYQYHINGTLERQTDALNQTTLYAYDALNRMLTADYASGPDTNWTYDDMRWPNQRGRTTNICVRFPGQACQTEQRWEYDQQGNTTLAVQTASGASHSVGYTYDRADRIRTMTYEPSSEIVTYRYDNAGRQVGLDSSFGGSYVTSQTYDALSQPIERRQGNDSFERRGYHDPTARLRTLDVFGANNLFLFGRDYWFDGTSNLRGFNVWDGGVGGQPRETHTFGYDGRDRLTTWNFTNNATATQPRSRTWNYQSPSGSGHSELATGDVARYASGPCAGRATNTCQFDARAYSEIGGVPTETVIAYGSYWNYHATTGALRSSGALTDVARYRDGPCAVRPAGSTCTFDTYTVALIGSTLTESITAYGRYWNYNANTGAFMSSGDLTSVARYANGPCAGRAAGTCQFDTVAFTTINGVYTESITAYGQYWNFNLNNLSAISQISTGTLASVPRYANGPCRDVVGTCRFDTVGFFPNGSGGWLESITASQPIIVRQPGGGGSWQFDPLGNLTNANGTAYSYGANGNGTGAGPHQARNVGGGLYQYDANGNLTSGGGRTYTWNAAGRPTAITANGATESYTYDGSGQRATRTAGGQTTVYAWGVFEQGGGNLRRYILFNGQAIAQREGNNALTYLHGDHLGSVSVTTDGAGNVASRTTYHPWGTTLNGGATSRNYTGQYRDGTGLLYYNARYYDPALGRFISADTLVPGANGLTVNGFSTTSLGRFTPGGSGPVNPQELNRYAYALNNPLKYTDPSGHFIDTLVDVGFIAYGIYDIGANGYTHERGLALAADVVAAVIPGVTGAGALVRAAGKADEVVAAAKTVGAATSTLSQSANTVKAATSLPPKAPDFIVTPKGEAIPVPNGATGPFATRAPGFQYVGGSGGKGMDKRVADVRIMEANKNQGRRAVYMNKSGQIVDPSTGGTVANAHPRAHHHLEDWK